jgi:hypothetical protein
MFKIVPHCAVQDQAKAKSAWGLSCGSGGVAKGWSSKAIKNGSICQRSLSMAVMVGEKDKNAARILADGLDAAQLEKLAGLLLTSGYGADLMEACLASLRLHCA